MLLVSDVPGTNVVTTPGLTQQFGVTGDNLGLGHRIGTNTAAGASLGGGSGKILFRLLSISWVVAQHYDVNYAVFGIII